MSIRKIGVVGSLAAGAAFALAPLAAAEPPDFSSILLGEVQSMNWLFGNAATLAAVDPNVITVGEPTLENPQSFSTISPEDLHDNTAFAALLFGVNWETEMSGDPGAYSLFNGAVTQFADASNVMLYALMTGGGEIAAEDAGNFLIGSGSGIAAGLAGDGFFEDFTNFFNAGVADLGGYFGAGALDV
ncbi:hypothetical protein MTER_26490 [Mycolicibacter terrae]|uniref:PEP-CTERM sorting domain-containing protein n=1 Tax=Mycolicibacter terrae TaxID=1788 RepID=A0AAD1HYU2_9MYCO|nr:hypothetical protein [Mycolicibacter terrae]ORW96384.1 hypothetical protein AWC28_10320 [Mycolicibacter terrae]BBX23238.1 hypothetical protein MTER_26490 [Mycolicibacter terrae]SNV66145.1 Uncharacterised protein [Mycolicibacter terrae]